MSALHPLRRWSGCALLVTIAVITGCTTTPTPTPDSSAASTHTAPPPPAPEFVPVVRRGRYTLVELAPTAAQRDPLQQIVDITLPSEARATVGDGLRHILKRSGYRLCETPSAAGHMLDALPLPAAHLHLGPLTLRDALLTLAGSAWELRVDDATRQVCFVRAGNRGDAVEADVPAIGPDHALPAADGIAEDWP